VVGQRNADVADTLQATLPWQPFSGFLHSEP